MDTHSVNDRTAVWQAAVVYRQEYELTEPDAVLAEVQAAYELAQEANRGLHERSWEWEIDEAETKVENALDQLLKPSRTSASVRKKRERWTRARERVKELSAAYEQARERARATQEDYLRVLNQHY